ncbi:uncharacterized protein LOC8282853 isoform X2 [Ricinus communis]|uniref:Structural maintenance of chromosomes protein n=1 Tax=Ricinus communis TaxID=3988 RepID=B9SA86_RICCO|nr:uncharacterized protein LOC8282853 isoform X2 [Ricinus communis]EEF39505.1 hypothetical protein RCOM_0864030 [Ricinus communis]|eukprot:XP_002522905.1 uncharacterized protein LOC8282853 [Ricinus communis]
MASRYNSYDSRSSTTSSHFSDPSSSTEFNYNPQTKNTSRALVKAKPSDLSQTKIKTKSNDHNLGSMVKKFMEKRPMGKGSSSNKAAGLVIPCDLIAEDLKKTARKGTSFIGLQKKLFGKEKKTVKALTEVKGNVNSGNTRTLAMVLRSERELLSANKEQEMEIAELKLMLESKNREVEKLKDLCLKQREEIKALKSAILFPDVMNSQLQELLEKQGSELKQAKQLIPTLQKQVTSLTGQLQCLAEDLAEVKADKYTRACIQNHGSSPRTPTYDHEEATNSLEFSSCDAASPGSPDDMFPKDFNPCLTPYYAKTKSKEFEAIGYDSPLEESLSEENRQMSNELRFNSRIRKMSKSSDCYKINNNAGSTKVRATHRSDESKCTYGKQISLRHF